MFDDVTAGARRVSGLLVGPAFDMNGRHVFAELSLDGYASIAWPNGADLDAWVLHELTASETTASRPPLVAINIDLTFDDELRNRHLAQR